MNWLNRLPGFTRSAPGLEWSIWKRLPAILLWGTAVPLALAAAAWLAAPEPLALTGLAGLADLSIAAQDPALLLTLYQLVGLVLLHWTLVLTLAIGCALVIVMKGPAFEADPYPPPGRE